jgi:hypothetical protein
MPLLKSYQKLHLVYDISLYFCLAVIFLEYCFVFDIISFTFLFFVGMMDIYLIKITKGNEKNYLLFAKIKRINYLRI